MCRSKWRMSPKVICSIVILLFIGCRGQQVVPADWPQVVKSVLLVPGNAKKIKYYRIYESYQVGYELNECYPAKDFMAKMVNTMQQKGWQRQEYDLLNPTFKAPHIKHPYGYGWDEGASGNEEVTMWVDNWKDKDENVVLFMLNYKGKDPSETSCNLRVTVSYVGADDWKKEEEILNNKIREYNDKSRNPKGEHRSK